MNGTIFVLIENIPFQWPGWCLPYPVNYQSGILWWACRTSLSCDLIKKAVRPQYAYRILCGSISILVLWHRTHRAQKHRTCDGWVLYSFRARLRTWTSTAEPAQTDQAWAGLPQLLQHSLFAHLYRFSPAQASWCLWPNTQPGSNANCRAQIVFASCCAWPGPKRRKNIIINREANTLNKNVQKT